MENVILTNMCMVEDVVNNKVLVLNRAKGNWRGIVFPGGHVEQGESIIDSTIREVREETGLTIKNLKACGIKNWYDEDKNLRYIVFQFKTSDFEGDLIESTHEGEVFWTDKDNIRNLTSPKGFEMNLEVILNDEINECYIIKNEEKTEWQYHLK